MQPDSGNNVQIHAPLWWNHKFGKKSSHAFCALALQIGLLCARYVAQNRFHLQISKHIFTYSSKDFVHSLVMFNSKKVIQGALHLGIQ